MRLRRLTKGETALAAEVFDGALDTRLIRLAMKAPTGGWAIALFGLIVFPRDVADFAAEPLHMQAWFIHELTHVWQFQHRPLWTLTSWVRMALSGGYLTRAAYRYTLPVIWERLNLEQQAKVVEHRFLLERGAQAQDMPLSASLSTYPNPLMPPQVRTKAFTRNP